MNENEDISSGTKWTTLSTVSVALAQILRLAILARFLTKADFGLVAIVTFVLGLTQTFCDLGFSSAIMSKKDLTKEEFSTLYWIQFFLFLSIYVILNLFTPLIASYYKDPVLVILLIVALLDIPFWAIGKLYDTLFQKYFQFKAIAIRNLVSVISSLVIAVVLAYFDFGALSLVISTVVQNLIFNVWTFVKGQKLIRIGFIIRAKMALPLIKVGAYQMGTQIVDYVASRLDIMIIGRLLGKEYLGVYNLAKELALKIILVINSIVNKVALPFFSYNQDDLEGMKVSYLKMIRLLTSITFPICYFLGVFSFVIVPLFYGKDYADVIPILSILSIWALLVSVNNPVGNVVIATGRTDYSFGFTLVRILYATPIVLLACNYNILVVAFAQLSIAILDTFFSWLLQIRKVLNIDFVSYNRHFAPSFFIISVACAFFYWLSIRLKISTYNAIPCISYVIVICFMSATFFYFFWRKEYNMLLMKFFMRNIKNDSDNK